MFGKGAICKFVRCEISQITALWSAAKIGKVSVPLSVAKTTCFPSGLRHKLIIQFINSEDTKQDSRMDSGNDLLRVYDKWIKCVVNECFSDVSSENYLQFKIYTTFFFLVLYCIINRCNDLDF